MESAFVKNNHIMLHFSLLRTFGADWIESSTPFSIPRISLPFCCLLVCCSEFLTIIIAVRLFSKELSLPLRRANRLIGFPLVLENLGDLEWESSLIIMNHQRIFMKISLCVTRFSVHSLVHYKGWKTRAQENRFPAQNHSIARWSEGWNLIFSLSFWRKPLFNFNWIKRFFFFFVFNF